MTWGEVKGSDSVMGFLIGVMKISFWIELYSDLKTTELLNTFEMVNFMICELYFYFKKNICDLHK